MTTPSPTESVAAGSASFERDHTRDLDAKAAAIETGRITLRQITKQPQRLAARLHKILQDRRG